MFVLAQFIWHSSLLEKTCYPLKVTKVKKNGSACLLFYSKDVQLDYKLCEQICFFTLNKKRYILFTTNVFIKIWLLLSLKLMWTVDLPKSNMADFTVIYSCFIKGFEAFKTLLYHKACVGKYLGIYKVNKRECVIRLPYLNLLVQ